MKTHVEARHREREAQLRQDSTILLPQTQNNFRQRASPVIGSKYHGYETEVLRSGWMQVKIENDPLDTELESYQGERWAAGSGFGPPVNRRLHWQSISHNMYVCLALATLAYTLVKLTLDVIDKYKWHLLFHSNAHFLWV